MLETNRRIQNKHDIFENNARKDQPTKIWFGNYMTVYYRQLRNHLKMALEQGKIHSFRFAVNGFSVKKTQEGENIVIFDDIIFV